MMKKNLALFSLGVLAASQLAAQVVVPWASRNTVDSDGDGVPDLFDNAPGVANNQADTDADGIGDAIDPTPNQSDPFLGDPGLGLLGPYTITPGSHVFIDYTLTLTLPPGGFGHIDLDLGGDNVEDATYFGPLTGNFNQIDIAPGLFSDPLWNLNVPGTYTLQARAYGPGVASQNFSITTVTVVPEPATFGLLLAGIVTLAWRRKRPPHR